MLGKSRPGIRSGDGGDGVVVLRMEWNGMGCDAMRCDRICLLSTRRVDLHRPALPAADAARLPAHLLRRLSEGVVCFPSLDGYVDSPVHVPLVPRIGAVHAAQRLCHDAAG
jgi:hypothetical protein